MRNALTLLQQKELDLARVRKEIEALRMVAALLCDDRDQAALPKEGAIVRQSDLQRTGTDGFSLSNSGLSFRADEISRDLPFLMPKRAHAALDFGQEAHKKNPVFPASVQEAQSGWRRYGCAVGLLVLIAMSMYLVGHWVRGAPAIESGAGDMGAHLQPTSKPETNPDRGQVAVHASEPGVQQLILNQPNPSKGDTPTGQWAQAGSSQAQPLVEAVWKASQATSENGSQELMLARRYLLGRGVGEDHTAAAKWLWRSVAKQNAEAALLLSHLYARGDGVTKSCDQAGILLNVAVKRHPSTTGPTRDANESDFCQ